MRYICLITRKSNSASLEVFLAISYFGINSEVTPKIDLGGILNNNHLPFLILGVDKSSGNLAAF